MESEIWPKWLQRGVNRRTIDQTVISPDITTLLKQKMTGYQLLIVILGFWSLAPIK
jgi:hypothetical protein